MQLTASTRMPSARATSTSGTVDIPTASAPSDASMRISAGVSYDGPSTPAYTPSATVSPSADAARRKDAAQAASYGADMSGNRGSPGCTGPRSGLRQVRLMWSRTTISVPATRPARIPPAALEMSTDRTPSAWSTRMGSATRSAESPSYRCSRPTCTMTSRSATVPRRSSPACPGAVAAARPGSAVNGIRRARSMCRVNPWSPEPSTTPIAGRAPADSEPGQPSPRAASAAAIAGATVSGVPLRAVSTRAPPSGPGGDRRDRRRRTYGRERGVEAPEPRLALGPRLKGRRQSGARDRRQLLEGEMECACRVCVFGDERRAAHEAIVGAQHDGQAAVEVCPERVARVVGRGRRLDVAGEADLDRDPPIDCVRGECGIEEEPRAMSDPVRPAPVDRRPHGVGAVALPRVARARQVVLAREQERRRVRLRWVAGLGPREVEAHDAVGPVGDGEPRRRERRLGAQMPQRADDDAGRDAVGPLGARP